jgi:hypothetical protein
VTIGPDDHGDGGGDSSGYLAEWERINRRAWEADDVVVWLKIDRDRLLEVFDREGNPLGHDQYGAALEKNLYKIRQGILDAFRANVGEAESVRDRLRENAATYQRTESGGNPDTPPPAPSLSDLGGAGSSPPDPAVPRLSSPDR